MILLMMFKIQILQGIYNLSDDQTEFQITDRLSFMRFLNLKMSDKVFESKTIWNFRDSLIFPLRFEMHLLFGFQRFLFLISLNKYKSHLLANVEILFYHVRAIKK